jgi:sn-glycerol 3-phosphate transport system substrate-binding protein
MTAPGRTPAEYKAAATFLQFLGKPEIDAQWSQGTGYVPVTLAGFELSQKQGYTTRTGRRYRGKQPYAAM